MLIGSFTNIISKIIGLHRTNYHLEPTLLKTCMYVDFIIQWDTIHWMCQTSSHTVTAVTWRKTNENAHVLHLLRVDGVQNSPNNFDLDPVILTYYLWPWPATLTLVTLTLDHLFWIRLKTGIFTFLTLVTLTFNLGLQSSPWYDFRSIGPAVQPVERNQTDKQTNTTENITSSANAGGNKSLVYTVFPKQIIHLHPRRVLKIQLD